MAFFYSYRACYLCIVLRIVELKVTRFLYATNHIAFTRIGPSDQDASYYEKISSLQFQALLH